MLESGSDAGRPLRVFISYSRKDEAFTRELVAGLKAAAFEPYLDQHDIAAGEAWEIRLSRLIETADTIVFVISPDSIASERCAWEVKRTTELNKRLLPIVWRTVDETLVPAVMTQINYIYFDKPHSFGPSLLVLVGALKTDIDWVREHTRIAEAATRWNMHKRADALLWRGEELAAAKRFLANQPTYAQEPTLLTREFINASENAESSQQNLERQRLEQMAAAQDAREEALRREKAALIKAEDALREAQFAARNRQRAQRAVGALLISIIAGLISWINQDTIKDRVNWQFVVRPYMTKEVQPYLLTAKSERELQPGQTFRECARSCPEMIVLPPGRFMMGSADGVGNDDERPQREVKISRRFAVSKYEVTFEEWDVCVSLGRCPDVSDSGEGRGRQPVINVSWHEAKRYLSWLTAVTGQEYRLLSEAEWEYAARAGSVTVYHWGDDIGRANANCVGCGSQWDKKKPGPVGSFSPNGFGLYDMHGNVWSWVEDNWHPNYVGAPVDGSTWPGGDKSLRVLRGGSWYDDPSLLRSAGRLKYPPDSRDYSTGFRIARTLKGDEG